MDDLSERLRVQAVNIEADGWVSSARLMRGAADRLDQLEADLEIQKHSGGYGI